LKSGKSVVTTENYLPEKKNTKISAKTKKWIFGLK
jgi:hypothetical protein